MHTSTDHSDVIHAIDAYVRTDALNVDKDAPIGVFDSGFGGLTVLRQLARILPHESYIFFGDRGRCPYGPREQSQVNAFVQQICAWFVSRGVKMIIIACNTATAAGLVEAQKHFNIPILGVIDPGARGAVAYTKNKRVGVIATQGTVRSQAYTKAIHKLDKRITVYSMAAPRFVEIAERGLRMSDSKWENYLSRTSDIYIRPEFRNIAISYLDPLRRADIDTLVLACTHFPLLAPLISSVIGNDVTLVDPAIEVSQDARAVLQQVHFIQNTDHKGTYAFYCSGDTQKDFKDFASRVMHMDVMHVHRLDFPDPV